MRNRCVEKLVRRGDGVRLWVKHDEVPAALLKYECVPLDDRILLVERFARADAPGLLLRITDYYPGDRAWHTSRKLRPVYRNPSGVVGHRGNVRMIMSLGNDTS